MWLIIGPCPACSLSALVRAAARRHQNLLFSQSSSINAHPGLLIMIAAAA